MAGKYQVELLVKLAHQIKTATEFVDSMGTSSESLLTSADLSRVFGIPHEACKRHIKFLKDLGIIRIIGMTPKRYRFDGYRFRQLLEGEEHPNELEAAFLANFEARGF